VTERKARFGPVPVGTEVRFWALVKKGSGCWEWQGTTSRGYGNLRVGSSVDGARRKILAHRYSLSLSLGREVVGLVLHRCDNKLCVRPEHLYEGTASQNMQDAYDRGQIVPYDRHGERNSNVKHGRFVMDRARAERIGLVPVDCGLTDDGTRNDFYCRPSVDPTCVEVDRD